MKHLVDTGNTLIRSHGLGEGGSVVHHERYDGCILKPIWVIDDGIRQHISMSVVHFEVNFRVNRNLIFVIHVYTLFSALPYYIVEYFRVYSAKLDSNIKYRVLL